MEYKGKLFGKVGKTYFPLELTTTDVEKLQEESAQWNLYAKSVDEQIVDRNSLIDKLQAENETLRHNYEVEYRDSGVYQNELAKLKELLSRVRYFINLHPDHSLMTEIEEALKGE